MRMLLILLLLLFPALSYGLDKPSREEALKFIDYYYKGQDKGPLLAQMQICQDVAREDSPLADSCIDPLPKVPKDKETYLWMVFVVPKDSEENIVVQLEHAGIIRMTREFSIHGSFPYSVFEKVTFRSPGMWTAKVLRTRQGMNQNLGESRIFVVD